MNTSLLNVLQNAADIDFFAIAQGIDVGLNRALQEAIKIDRVIGADARGLRHIGAQMLGVVRNHHATATQYIAGANEQRIANARRHSLGLLKRGGLARRRIHDLQAVEQCGKALAVLGEVDGIGLGAHDVHTGILQHARKLERSLTAQRDHDTVGALHIDDIHDVLVRKRFEVQAVGRVVIGRDRLGIAVDHDGLKAAARQRVTRVHAAVVKLNALTNAVGAGTQNHRLGLIARRYLVGGNRFARAGIGAHEVLVRLVVVLGGTCELGGAGVDRLHAGDHAQALAIGAHKALIGSSEIRNLGIARTILLEQAHGVGIDILHAHAAHGLLHLNHIVNAVEIPRVNLADVMHALDGPAAAEGLDHIEDAILGRRSDSLSKLVIVQLGGTLLATGGKTHMAVFQRAHRLAKGFLKRAADGHDLAHGLHAGGERGVGTLEFLEGEARDLDHAVVDSGFEARRGGLGDIVGNLVEGIAHGKLCGKLGDGESRSLRSQCRGTRNAWIHLDDNKAAVLGVHGKLHVGAAGLHANLLENGKRCHAHALIFKVGKRLCRRHGNGVAGVHAHGVEVLDGAHDDAVAGVVAHDLHLILFPALDGFFHQHLVSRRKLNALAHDGDELFLGMRDAAAGAAKRKAGAQDARVPHALDNGKGVFHRVGIAGARHLESNLGHGFIKELAILAALDGGQVATDHLDATFVENSSFCQVNGSVESSLTAEGGKQRVRMLTGDDLFQKLGSDGLNVGAVGQAGIGHDRRGIRVEQHDLVAVLLEDLAGLSARVVKLASLTNDDRTGANDEDTLDIGTFRHENLLDKPAKLTAIAGERAADASKRRGRGHTGLCLRFCRRGSILGIKNPTSKTVLGNIDVQVVDISIHQARESRKEVMRVGGTGSSFGMVLHGESGAVQQLDALSRTVIKVDMCKANASKTLVLHHGRNAALRPYTQVAIGRMLGLATRELRNKLAQAREHKAEAVILRRNLHAMRDKVHNRLISTAMAKLKLFHLGTAGKTDHLMAQTDAKQRHLANELLHLRVCLFHGIRVTRAIGKKDAIGIHFQHMGSRRIPRNNCKLAANAHQTLEDAALDAAVVHDHAILGGCRGSIGEGVSGRQVRSRVRILVRAAHGLDQVLAHQCGRLGELCLKLCQVKDLGRNNALLSTMIAQMAHERTGIDTLYGHDAVVFEVFGQAYRATPIGRGMAHIAHNHAAKSGSCGTALG